MKNKFSVTALALIVTLAACKDAPKADEAQTTAAQSVQTNTAGGQEYKADLQKSTIQWTGTKPTGRHPGNFRLLEGKLSVADNSIQGGNFVINVADLKAYDEDGSANAKLETHLKSADFLDVSKYGTATFEITQVQPGADNKNLVMKDATHTITGNLKMKDITKSITFPAKISITEGMVTADAEFNINRTLWGINYHSDKSLGDKFINEDVNIKLHLEATNPQALAAAAKM